MTDLRTAAEMALERLESHEYWMDEEAIKALRQALAQPEQEPVAWMCEGNDWGVWKPTVILGNDLETHKKSSAFRNWQPLYTAPPKREWQGLTDSEVVTFMKRYPDTLCWLAAKAIEAKLKEKNHETENTTRA